MHYFILTLIQIIDSIAELILVSLGLAVIFGMMRVINLAHGEFIMLGGFTSILAVNHGINVWIAILVVSPIVVGIVGLVIERLVIRHLYGRMIDTMLATWGLSLLLTGLATALLVIVFRGFLLLWGVPKSPGSVSVCTTSSLFWCA